MHEQFVLPYRSQSPITYDDLDFNTENDIWNEVEKIANKNDNKRTLGQDLFYLIPLFANPKYIINEFAFNLINEFHYVKDYNIPLSLSMDQADALKLDYFTIIKNELTAGLQHKQEKNGTKS